MKLCSPTSPESPRTCDTHERNTSSPRREYVGTSEFYKHRCTYAEKREKTFTARLGGGPRLRRDTSARATSAPGRVRTGPRPRRATEANVPAHRAAWPQRSSPHQPPSRERSDPAQRQCERTGTCLLGGGNQEDGLRHRFWRDLSADLTRVRTARAGGTVPEGPRAPHGGRPLDAHRGVTDSAATTQTIYELSKISWVYIHTDVTSRDACDTVEWKKRGPSPPHPGQDDDRSLHLHTPAVWGRRGQARAALGEGRWPHAGPLHTPPA